MKRVKQNMRQATGSRWIIVGFLQAVEQVGVSAGNLTEVRGVNRPLANQFQQDDGRRAWGWSTRVEGYLVHLGHDSVTIALSSVVR